MRGRHRRPRFAEELNGVMVQIFDSLSPPARTAIFKSLLRVGGVGIAERVKMLGMDEFLKEELSKLLAEATEQEERIASYWELPKREHILGKVLLPILRSEIVGMRVVPRWSATKRWKIIYYCEV